jgi:hypothetical protein
MGQYTPHQRLFFGGDRQGNRQQFQRTQAKLLTEGYKGAIFRHWNAEADGQIPGNEPPVSQLAQLILQVNQFGGQVPGQAIPTQSGGDGGQGKTGQAGTAAVRGDGRPGEISHHHC